MKKIFWMTEYGIKARIYPAIVCSAPFLIFGHFYLNKIIPGFTENLLAFKFFGDISVAIVLIFLFALLGRFISIEFLENRYFKNGIAMPTTELLLHSNDFYTSEYKNNAHKKILKEFNVNLLDEKSEEADDKNARKKIVEAVSFIKERVGNGRLLLQRNIEYGFFRNLVGGSVFALPMSIFDVSFFYRSGNMMAFGFAVSFGLVFGSCLIFAKKIIVSHGYIYAKTLIREYMSN